MDSIDFSQSKKNPVEKRHRERAYTTEDHVKFQKLINCAYSVKKGTNSVVNIDRNT